MTGRGAPRRRRGRRRRVLVVLAPTRSRPLLAIVAALRAGGLEVLVVRPRMEVVEGRVAGDVASLRAVPGVVDVLPPTDGAAPAKWARNAKTEERRTKND